jgi:hypothetical protein
MREKRLNEKGAILVLALLFLLILTTLGLGIVFNSQIDHAISNNYSKTVRATFAAQTGIERMKPYLLYDLKRDKEGWKNEILWVPDGTPGALQGGTSDCPSVPDTSDCFDLSGEGAPSASPYDVVDDLADAQIASIWTPENPAGWGTYGYQTMLRNISATVGFDRNKICVLAGGFSDNTIGLLGTTSRGSDLVEQCLVGEDISIWNNIIFIEGGGTSGMGNFKIHGNVHIIGPPLPPAVADINVEVKGNQGWYNDYTSGSPITSTLAAVLDPDEASKTSLEAKIRDRNGLIDAQNTSAEFGTTSVPYDSVFGCDDCGGVFGFTTFASQFVRATELGPYDVPANVLSKVKVPLISDQYTDERGVLYPNYLAYLIGVQNAGGISNNNLPGVLGLQLASLNMPGNTLIHFGNNTSNSFADKVADTTERNEIFAANVNISANTNPVQQLIDPHTEADPLFAPSIASGNTYMLVATDTANEVVVLYKETTPFDRSVDKDLGGAGGFSTLHTSRQVNGLVFARQGTLSGVTLTVDLDGADLDGNGTEYSVTLDTTQSARLLRKVVNALWLASQGICMADSSQPCISASISGDGTSFNNTLSTDLMAGGATTGILKADDAPKLIGSGVIQMPDQFEFDDVGLRYAGRFSFFTSETSGSSTAATSGSVDLRAGPRPVPSYTASGVNYSFPCQNSMGIMAARQIEMGEPSIGTHDEFVGAFYAFTMLKVEKQIQILGAIVAKDFDLSGGGNPDWFQAMQMSRCLPPEMIGKEPVVYIRSQSYSDR